MIVMHVVGIFGYIGSGKDTVAAFFEKRGYKNYSYGDLLRAASLSAGRTVERHDLQLTRQEHDAKYCKEHFPNIIVEKIVADKCEKAIISGIRNPEDAIVPKKHFGKDMILIFVDADAEVRYTRLKKRGREGDPTAFSAFSRQESRERRIFDFKTTEKLCDVAVKNNSSLNRLEKNIEKIMEKIKD